MIHLFSESTICHHWCILSLIYAESRTNKEKKENEPFHLTFSVLIIHLEWLLNSYTGMFCYTDDEIIILCVLSTPYSSNRLGILNLIHCCIHFKYLIATAPMYLILNFVNRSKLNSFVTVFLINHQTCPFATLSAKCRAKTHSPPTNFEIHCEFRKTWTKAQLINSTVNLWILQKILRLSEISLSCHLLRKPHYLIM